MRRISVLSKQIAGSDEAPVQVVRVGRDLIWASAPGSVNGIPKINQDAVNASTAPTESKAETAAITSCCCLCDGHGDYGELVSAYVSKAIATGAAESPESEGDLSDNIQQGLVQTLGERIMMYSGSTAVWVRRESDSNALRVCNVGDSRCIIVDKSWNLVFQSRDHKPDDPDETKRIEACGGRVIMRPGNVPRVAGLALSRAFGDFAASSSGVCAVPDVTVIKNTKTIAFVLLTSDGVVDVLSPEQIVAFIRDGLSKSPSKGLEDVLKELVQLCRELWLQDTDGEYCDDITCTLWSFA